MTTTASTSRPSSSSERPTIRVPTRSGEFVVRCSTRGDGDFHLTRNDRHELERRRRGLVDLPWTMLRHEHGVRVRRVDAPGAHDGADGDIAVTALANAVLGTWAADCAPVVVLGADREIGAAHAGWRGLAGGVLQATLDAMDEPPALVALGPTIGPCCYEFGVADLDIVAAGVGVDPAVIAARTADGRYALDVPAAIAGFTAAIGVPLVRLGGCTGCGHDGYSHRVRRDPERHVVAAWRTEVAS